MLKLPIDKTAKGVARLSIGIIALAVLLEKAPLFSLEAFSLAISRFQKAAVADTNTKALEQGRMLVAALD